MAESVRRSGRARQPNTKYTVDPFDGLEKALYASSDSGSSSTSALPDEDSEEDVEFVAPADLPEEEEDEEDEVNDAVPSSDSEVEAFNEPNDDEIAVDDLEPDHVANLDNTERVEREVAPGQRVVVPRARNLKGSKFQTRAQGDTHTRGVDEMRTKGAKEQRVLYLFGPTKEDIEPVLKTRDKWLWNPTLPSRTADENGTGGMGPSFYTSEDVRAKEFAQTKNWYFEEGARDAFASGQHTDLLTSTDAPRYLPKADYDHHSFLAGPLNKQKPFTLKIGESVRVAKPFEDDRPGFILNLGAKVMDTQWAPIVEGSTQYLAIAILQENPSLKKGQNPKSPAYAPQLPFPASIQIWAFEALDNGTMDSHTPPRLDLVICTDWASIKQLKWCPVTLSDTVRSEGGTHIHLGLLAAIWGDGKVRVIDIKYPESATPTTTYLHVSRAAFESRPANTVCTCLTWASPRTIAVGTAVGTVAIWTLDNSTLSASDPRADAIPWFYYPIHDSYILSLETAYPSRPSFLSTLCADGYIRLIDIRSPTLDSVVTPRQRVFCLPLLWHDHTQSFVAADENFYVRILPIRRFYMHNLVVRSPSFVTCAATSSTHPILMTGGAGGEVTTGNILRRALDIKCESWQQVWFAYEWRRPVQADKPNNAANTITNASNSHSNASVSRPESVASRPLSRFVTGHEPALQFLMPRGRDVKASEARKRRKVTGTGPTMDGPIPPTIYEEQQAVTALAWNPNVKVGGWAAAGLGSGLVRVEDLCVE